MINLEEALHGLKIGPYRYFEQVGSTNDEAAHWADLGAPDLALVVANEQTAGRGRLQRRWFTPPDAALAFSVIMRIPTPEVTIAATTALGTVAVCEAIEELFDLKTEIKWPNDVLVQRKKLAGILAEAYWQNNELDYIILGIGINIASKAIPAGEELIYPATSIEDCMSQAGAVDRFLLLRATLDHLLTWRSKIGGQEFMAAWDHRLAFRDEWVQISPALARDGAFAGQSIRSGRVLGLAPDGNLRLLDDRGEIFTVHMGEVHLRPTSG
jgi:BirA family transcriptional regulator, biotin operon repressor / biotin---[acetyl-CoA-carboxylase] ligase